MPSRLLHWVHTRGWACTIQTHQHTRCCGTCSEDPKRVPSCIQGIGNLKCRIKCSLCVYWHDLLWAIRTLNIPDCTCKPVTLDEVDVPFLGVIGMAGINESDRCKICSKERQTRRSCVCETWDQQCCDFCKVSAGIRLSRRRLAPKFSSLDMICFIWSSFLTDLHGRFCKDVTQLTENEWSWYTYIPGFLESRHRVTCQTDDDFHQCIAVVEFQAFLCIGGRSIDGYPLWNNRSGNEHCQCGWSVSESVFVDSTCSLTQSLMQPNCWSCWRRQWVVWCWDFSCHTHWMSTPVAEIHSAECDNTFHILWRAMSFNINPSSTHPWHTIAERFPKHQGQWENTHWSACWAISEVEVAWWQTALAYSLPSRFAGSNNGLYETINLTHHHNNHTPDLTMNDGEH